MANLFDKLIEDVRFQEGMKACINCGTCSAICPAAQFYKYEPRKVVIEVQSKNEQKIESLLRSETIWYCGECMSCKTRCPRGNTPGLIIIALRSLSQDLGYFTESEKGRQQLAIKRTIGEWILNHGYCVITEGVTYINHPEQGPLWDWELKNIEKVMERVGANFRLSGSGTLRKIPDESLEELKKIFDVTGGTQRFENLERFSAKKAAEMKLELNKNADCEYIKHIYNYNNENHQEK